jgi:hypothetical protein
MKGVHLQTVQQILGHKSFVTTLRYAHMAPDLRNEAVERLCEVADGHFWDTSTIPRRVPKVAALQSAEPQRVMVRAGGLNPRPTAQKRRAAVSGVNPSSTECMQCMESAGAVIVLS